LQDHQASAVCFEVADGVQTADPLLRDPKLFRSLLETYKKDRSGPLGQFFADSSHISPPETFGPGGKDFLPNLLNQVSPDSSSKSAYDKLKEEVLLDQFAKDDGATAHNFMAKIQFNVGGTDINDAAKVGNYFTIFTSLNQSFSQGSVHINSALPTDKPTMDPAYLAHPMDLELLARHVQFFSVLISTPPLSGFFKKGGERIPTDAFSNGTEAPSLDEAKELVRRSMLSNYHPMGTCAMLKRDLGGVVDERLRVYGVKGLRVVDASIFPLMTRGNPITSVYAVAERAVDLIKEDWKDR
jgi:choline dehydrogenase-like flavoprotein